MPVHLCELQHIYRMVKVPVRCLACAVLSLNEVKYVLPLLQVVDMDGCVGSIDTFVVEPFVPHKQEYYLCMQVTFACSSQGEAVTKCTSMLSSMALQRPVMVTERCFEVAGIVGAHAEGACSRFHWGTHMQSNRLGNDISFSDAGGVEIEENWDRVKKITLDAEQPADAAALAPLLSTLPLELRPDMEAFIQACYEVRVLLNGQDTQQLWKLGHDRHTSWASDDADPGASKG